MGLRRKARECALQMLFAADVTDMRPDELVCLYWAQLGDDTVDEPTREFATKLATGVMARIEEVDERIRSRAEHWRIPRMAIVDRNVLRLAVYEFLFEPTPRTVAINEALEVARRFSSYEATQFVNGILDAIKRDLDKERPEDDAAAQAVEETVKESAEEVIEEENDADESRAGEPQLDESVADESRERGARVEALKKRILIVDDSPATRALVAAALAHSTDTEVTRVASGFDAIKHLTQETVDLVLTDLNMPDINGLELVRFVKTNERFKSTPVILISTDATEADRQRAAQLGVDDYLAKPFTAAQLRDVIDKHLKQNLGVRSQSPE